MGREGSVRGGRGQEVGGERERRKSGGEGSGGEGRGREGRDGREREGKNDLTHPLSQIPGYVTAFLQLEYYSGT